MNKFSIQTEMTKDDYVITCGDLGGARSHDIQDGILNLDEEHTKQTEKSAIIIFMKKVPKIQKFFHDFEKT